MGEAEHLTLECLSFTREFIKNISPYRILLYLSYSYVSI